MKKCVGRQATRRPKSCLEKIKHKKRELGSSSSQLHVASPIEQLQTQQYQPPMTYMQLLVGQQLHTPMCGPAHAEGSDYLTNHRKCAMQQLTYMKQQEIQELGLGNKMRFSKRSQRVMLILNMKAWLVGILGSYLSLENRGKDHGCSCRAEFGLINNVQNAKQEAKAVAAQLHGGVGLHDFGAWLPSMEIYAHAHKEIDAEAAQEKILALDDLGNVEPSELIADMDSQIAKAKEEALSRKEILNKVEKWMSACEEESWLKRLTFIKGYWKEPYLCISSFSKFALGEFSILGSELLTLYCCNLL
ncbi:hypothetical protein Nepgr_009505 [Nepenthes gracilis]|uniref:Uncharacterized protein n=1 Tax=Nepenthes gracilis TaxID=150966 RepID=A0AAD3XKE7_NEPGR|nr:hypothetical protein Nepgr_009505 [Nepenthes gracilis]